jgi:hypothetical protein
VKRVQDRVRRQGTKEYNIICRFLHTDRRKMSKTPLVIPNQEDLRVDENLEHQIQIIIEQITNLARRKLDPRDREILEQMGSRLESLFNLQTERRTVLKARIMAATRRGHHRAGVDLLKEKHEELGRMLAERKATYEP